VQSAIHLEQEIQAGVAGAEDFEEIAGDEVDPAHADPAVAIRITVRAKKAIRAWRRS
jgi:hypothetical protein